MSKQLGRADGDGVLDGVLDGVSEMDGVLDSDGGRGDAEPDWLGGRPGVTVPVPDWLDDGVCVGVAVPDGCRYA